MRNTLLILAAFVACGYASAQTYVQPHITQNGTYVQGHMRSAPDGNPHNNYSTQGNTNPYTGQAGTVNPYNQPQPTYQQPRMAQPSQGLSGYPNPWGQNSR